MPGHTPKDAVRRWKEALGPRRARPCPRPDPSRTALLVIDAQMHFHEMLKPVLPQLMRVIGHFRRTNGMRIFTRHRHTDPATDGGMLSEWWGDLILEGTPDAQLIPELGVGPDERVLEKTRYNAFHGTPLGQELHERGITSLVIGGAMSNLCCETTARDAFVRDFRVYFLLDGTATATEEYHLATLRNLAFGFAHVLTCDELLALL